MQISVRIPSEKIWKCIRNVSDLKNLSKLSLLVVRKQSKPCQKCIFWQSSDTFTNTVPKMYHLISINVSIICQKILFLKDFWPFSDKTKWKSFDRFLKSDTVLRHFQIFSDRSLTDICIWQFFDRILKHLWLFSDTFLELTFSWQNSDRYLTVFLEHFWDLHWTWVPTRYSYSGSMSVPKVPKNSQISVRILSENCQLQKCVRKQS